MSTDLGGMVPDWFLTPDEITKSRGGVPRTNLRPYTLQGNTVKLLINGDKVFAALYRDLLATKAGDSIWMTGWDIDAAVMLAPDPDNPKEAAKSCIDAVLRDAIKRGVEVRGLLNTLNLLNPLNPFVFCHKLNSTAGKTVCAPDHRHNGITGSLHQKNWVIIHNGDIIAYVGSMDIAAGRYDTHAHDKDRRWQSEPPFPQNYYGFSGGMLRVEGPAALDVAWHLYNQISDPVNPFYFYTLAPVDPPAKPVEPATAPGGPQVQVLLTAGPRGGKKYGYYSKWAPKGELSILAATLKAISRAKEYIYLSDQFMWYPPIMEAVAAQLPYVKAVLFLTDSGYTLDHFIFCGLYDIKMIRKTKFYYQCQAWASLNPNDSKVSAYQVVKEDRPGPPPAKNMTNIIYTHWKVLIVDDEFAIIGSAGVEQSGMTNDLDMSLGIYDPAVVACFRKWLWWEHLKVSPDDPDIKDPVHGILSVWPDVAKKQGRVRRYWPEEVEYHWYYPYIFKVFEPCGLSDQGQCQK
jgi:phospholipase D1/2